MRSVVIILILAQGTAPGCGSNHGVNTYPVKLRILDAAGSPVADVQVTLRSVDHAVSAHGTTDRDGVCLPGTFQPGDGLAAGKHQVAVADLPPEGDPDERQPAKAGVAARFRRFSSSGLEIEVSSDGANEVDVRLEEEKK